MSVAPSSRPWGIAVPAVVGSPRDRGSRWFRILLPFVGAVVGRGTMAAVATRVGVGELRPEQEDLRDSNSPGAGGAVSCRPVALAPVALGRCGARNTL
jgi:hypothetical protein